MFDIGFFEITIILVVALLVVGPERLPSLARSVGQWYGKARRMVNSVRDEVERELRTDELRKILDEQQQQIRSLERTIDDAKRDIETETGQVVKAIDDDIRELEQPATETPAVGEPKQEAAAAPAEVQDERKA